MSSEKLTALLETTLSDEDRDAINAVLATRKETGAEKIILSKFTTLIASLRNRINSQLIYAYAVDSKYEVIVIVPSDMLSDFAHTASLVNNSGGISDMEMHVEVLDACEHNFKVKVTCKSK